MQLLLCRWYRSSQALQGSHLISCFLLCLHSPSLSILNVSFCAVLSPTCHMDVPYDTPTKHVHAMFYSKVYSRKGSLNRLTCPSHRMKGFTPSLHWNSSKSSILDHMLVIGWIVMLALSLYVTSGGTSTPLHVHVGPNGNMQSTQLLCLSFIASISSSKTFMLSLLSSSAFDKGLKPVVSMTLSFDAAIIIVHMMARPSSDMQPKIVKWLYLKEFCTCAHISFTSMNFFPPVLPSPFCEMCVPTWLKTSLYVCKSEKLVFRSCASDSVWTILLCLSRHAACSNFCHPWFNQCVITTLIHLGKILWPTRTIYFMVELDGLFWDDEIRVPATTKTPALRPYASDSVCTILVCTSGDLR
jgi:hypothetical protein